MSSQHARFVRVSMSHYPYFSFYYIVRVCLVFFFFFQAEDGIRDLTVTGVQTCALPICRARPQAADLEEREEARRHVAPHRLELVDASRVQELLDADRQILADAGKLLETATRGDGRNVLGQGLQHLGRPLVGSDAEDALVPDLEERRHLVKQE